MGPEKEKMEVGESHEKERLGCRWLHVEYENYQTSCGHLFSFFADTPKQNGFMFCPYCGKILISY